MKNLKPALAILGVLAAIFALDYYRGNTEDTQETELALGLPALLQENTPLNTVWYCPLGSSDSAGVANHRVFISNVGSADAVASVTVLTEDGLGSSEEVPIPSKSSKSVLLSDIQKSEWASALVEIRGGVGVVNHSVQTPREEVQGSCATEASSSWYFASGRTKDESKAYIALMNPFSEDVSLDIELQAIAGNPKKPESLQGLTVSSQSVKVVELDSLPGLAEEDHIGMKIETRNGRIVAERLQVVDERVALDELLSEDDESDEDDAETDIEEITDDDTKIQAAALQIGLPNPREESFHTSGKVTQDGSSLLLIYNPSETKFGVETATNDEGVEYEKSVLLEEGTANVVIEIWPNQKSERADVSYIPIQRSINPSSIESIDLSYQVRRLGFQVPVDFSVQVKSTNGVPLVAERWQYGEKVEDLFSGSSLDLLGEGDGIASEVGDAAEVFGAEPKQPDPPEASVGLATSLGSGSVASKKWFVPWVATPSDSSSWVTIYAVKNNTNFSITHQGGAEPIQDSIVIEGNRKSVKIPSMQSATGESGGWVEIVSDKDIYVEAQVVSEELNQIISPVPVLDDKK